jgi:hypothetical protein
MASERSTLVRDKTVTLSKPLEARQEDLGPFKPTGKHANTGNDPRSHLVSSFLWSELSSNGTLGFCHVRGMC